MQTSSITISTKNIIEYQMITGTNIYDHRTIRSLEQPIWSIDGVGAAFFDKISP